MNEKKNKNDEMDLLVSQIVAERISERLDEKFKEWKSFTFRDRTFDAIIAFTLGIAFSKLITAFSEGLIMPIVQFVGQYTGESWRQVVWEPIDSLQFELGQIYAATVDFILMSIILFTLWKSVKYFKKRKKDERGKGEERCQNV